MIKTVNQTFNIRGDQIKVDAPEQIDDVTKKPVFNEDLDSLAQNIAFNKYRKTHDYMSVDQVEKLILDWACSPYDLSNYLDLPKRDLSVLMHGMLPSNHLNAELKDAYNQLLKLKTHTLREQRI